MNTQEFKILGVWGSDSCVDNSLSRSSGNKWVILEHVMGPDNVIEILA